MSQCAAGRGLNALRTTPVTCCSLSLSFHPWNLFSVILNFNYFSFSQVDGEVSRTHGEAGPAIVALATEKKAAYIVVGCRGKGTIRRTVTGSVTDYVTHHSHVPVVVARHKDHLEHHQSLLQKLHIKDKKHKGDKDDKSKKSPEKSKKATKEEKDETPTESS